MTPDQQPALAATDSGVVPIRMGGELVSWTEAMGPRHPGDCKCRPCRDLREALAEIGEAEREAWRASRDIFIR